MHAPAYTIDKGEPNVCLNRDVFVVCLFNNYGHDAGNVWCARVPFLRAIVFSVHLCFYEVFIRCYEARLEYMIKDVIGSSILVKI